MSVIKEIIYDEQKIEICEKSYFLIGYARWGTARWLDLNYKPDITEYSYDISNFIKSVIKFSQDFNFGKGKILSSLTFIMFPDENADTFGNDDRGFYSNLFESDVYLFLRKQGLIHEITSNNSPRDTADLEIHEFDFSEMLFKNVVDLLNLIPKKYLIYGNVFIEFDNVIICITWNGWGVYVKRGGDIYFTRWFFDLINIICHLTPTVCDNEMNPFDNEYNPLE